MQFEGKRKLWFNLFSVLLVFALSVGCSHKLTDAEIASDVQNKINADANIPTKQIAVGNSNGVVTLSGTVGSDQERAAAANDASQVEGVKTVVNNLQVTPASNPPTTGAAMLSPTATFDSNSGNVPEF